MLVYKIQKYKKIVTISIIVFLIFASLVAFINSNISFPKILFLQKDIAKSIQEENRESKLVFIINPLLPSNRLVVIDFAKSRTSIYKVPKKAEMPAFSPSGKKISIVIQDKADNETYKLAIIDLKNSRLDHTDIVIPGESVRIGLVRWSSDEKYIYFAKGSKSKNKVYDIWSYDIQSRKKEIIEDASWRLFGKVNQKKEIILLGLAEEGLTVISNGKTYQHPKHEYYIVENATWVNGGNSIATYDYKSDNEPEIILLSPSLKLVDSFKIEEEKGIRGFLSVNPNGNKIIQVQSITGIIPVLNIQTKKIEDTIFADFSAGRSIWLANDLVLIENLDFLNFFSIDKIYSLKNKKWYDFKSSFRNTDFWSEKTNMKNTIPDLMVKE